MVYKKKEEERSLAGVLSAERFLCIDTHYTDCINGDIQADTHRDTHRDTHLA